METTESKTTHQPPDNTSANTTQPPPPSNRSTTKRKSKKKRKPRPNKPQTQTSITLRNPCWSYIHLQHINSSTIPPPHLDALTAHLHLTTALTQFLGLHGAAIANGVDILKLSRRDVWIRVAREDHTALIAAAGGWIGANGEAWRVRGWSSWDAGVTAGRRDGGCGGQDLFDG